MKNYANYTEVPFYRRNWFVLTLCLLLPLAIHLLIGNDLITEITAMLGLYVSTVLLFTGGIYYQRGAQQKKYGLAAKIILLIFCLTGSFTLLRHGLAKYYFQSGLAYQEDKNYYGAVDCYKKAEKWGKYDDELFFEMGKSYGTDGKFEDALRVLNIANKLNHENYDIYRIRSIVYEALSQPENAIIDLDKVLEHRPGDQELLKCRERNFAILRGPSIAGLYLGMTIDEAKEIMNTKLNEYLKEKESKSDSIQVNLEITEINGGFLLESKDKFYAVANSQRVVTKFVFINRKVEKITWFSHYLNYQSEFLDYVLQGQNYTSKEFLRHLMKNYNFPELNYRPSNTFDHLGSYTYSSNYGWEIEITATTGKIGHIAISIN